MPRLIVFNQVSLDGYVADTKGDMSWAHHQDDEWKAFTAENAKGEATFLFGRVTYEMMASFWPTPIAVQSLPDVARKMNSQRKVVFSRTLDRASWNNSVVVKSDLPAEVRKLKETPGPALVVMGSASVVAQLAQDGLVDEFQIVVNPVVLGGGKSMFAGVRDRIGLRRTHVRSFANGNTVLYYEPLR